VFEQAFTYLNGQTTVLGLIPGEGGIFSAASGINASGEVVGSGDNSQSDERAWKYQNGVMTDIGTLGGLIPANSGVVLSAAVGINDSGEIVANGTSNNGSTAFLLKPS
jgi:probable HAF family extracellular repeat protein